jgi:hypothetical protein
MLPINSHLGWNSPTPSQQWDMEQDLEESTEEDAYFPYGCCADDEMRQASGIDIDHALHGACAKASESEQAVPTSEPVPSEHTDDEYVGRSSSESEESTQGGGIVVSRGRRRRAIVRDDIASSPNLPHQQLQAPPQSRQHTARGGVRAMCSGDASVMSDYNEMHFGKGVTPKLPKFHLSGDTTSMWQTMTTVLGNSTAMRPVRSCCWQISAELIPTYATRFRHWQTPVQDTLRAEMIAAVIGMVMTPTSKGFM